MSATLDMRDAATTTGATCTRTAAARACSGSSTTCTRAATGACTGTTCTAAGALRERSAGRSAGKYRGREDCQNRLAHVVSP